MSFVLVLFTFECPARLKANSCSATDVSGMWRNSSSDTRHAWASSHPCCNCYWRHYRLN